MDTKKLTDRQESFYALRRLILNSYTIECLNDCMRFIDYFTHLYGEMEGTDENQSQLLEIHRNQTVAVKNGKKQSILKKFWLYITS